MTTVTLEGTQELMKQRDVAVILATGGMGLVRAAYSAGKPAYGVGPGNAPGVHRAHGRRARRRSATSSPARRSTTACSARRENSVVVDEPIAEEVKREFQAQGGYFMNDGRDGRASRRCSSRRSGCRTRRWSASRRPSSPRSAASRVPAGHARADRAARRASAATIPLSIEKLCPVLSFYVVKDWREGCERCKQILRYGGMGHTMSIHSQNEQVILEFGLKKPAFRIVVNTPTTHGSIGLTTGLDPAMTLGCGGYGGNITSDNISPRHLLNIKRLAYEITPVVSRWDRAAGAGVSTALGAGSAGAPSRPGLPTAPAKPASNTYEAEQQQ